MSSTHEVAIVGAGPIGLELAVALKREGVDHVHFDARQVGFTISWFPPQTRFFSSSERIAIAGVPLFTTDQSKASREEYLAYLRGVVRQFELQIRTYEPVVGVERATDHFVIATQPAAGARRSTRARRIVLATGGTDRPKLLNIPGEDLPHVDHYFRDPHAYFQKRLLVVGGKNSAVEAALRCHNIGARVSISYRGAKLPEKSVKYWLLPEIEHLIAKGRIEAYFESVPTKITHSHVTLMQKGKSIEVPADFVLLLTGYEQDPALFRICGIETRGDAAVPVFDERTMESNVPGIYLAGTATAGTQSKYTVFIENCHVHVDRIVAAITGKAPPVQRPTYLNAES